MEYDCRLNIAYPPVKTQGRNLRYAAILSDDYAGTVSEMTAVTQYFYQHLIIEDSNEQLAAALECISIVEMHHLDMIGKLITDFGGDPQFRVMNRKNKAFWSGRYPLYLKNPQRFIKADIQSEQQAIRNYRLNISQIDDIYVKKVLERIILDEENHIKIFESFLNRM